jgi:hypothetical protein
MPEILLAAKIAFRCLHRRVPQQELNLLQLSSPVMTQLRAGPPQVVRCDVLQPRSPTAGPDHVPHDILRDSSAPYLCSSRHGAEDPSLCDPGRSYPLIERRLHPCWNRHSADVAAPADQVYDCPVSVAHLDLIHLQAHQLRSAKAATQKHGQHCVVALSPHAAPTRMLEHFGTLLCAQPIQWRTSTPRPRNNQSTAFNTSLRLMSKTHQHCLLPKARADNSGWFLHPRQSIYTSALLRVDAVVRANRA